MQDEVVAPGKVFARVIDDRVGAQRAHEVEVARAADAGDLGAGRSRDLDGERAHAAGGADHQHALICLHPAVIAERLQGGAPCDRDARRLLERHRLWLSREPVDLRARELRERAVGRTEDRIPRREVGHPWPGDLDDAGDVASDVRVLRTPEARNQPHEERLAAHQVPLDGVRGRGVDPQEHLALARLRDLDLLEPQHVGRWAVPLTLDGSHRWHTA